MARRPKKMDKDRLRSIIRDEVRKATGAVGGELSTNRVKALQYYNGDPFGNEVNGRSKVVSTDVRDTVESLMPEFVEIFGGGDRVVEFEPVGKEDEEIAAQATDYVNHIWMRDIDGFGVTHDLIKDALLQKTGFAKIWWDEREVRKREVLTGLTILQLNDLAADESVEIIEHSEEPAIDPMLAQMLPDGMIHEATIIRTDKSGKVNAVCIPPEEFLRSRGATGLDDARFLCHRYKRTVSDLIEEGYDRETVLALAGGDDVDWLTEVQARDLDGTNWPEGDDSDDPAMREVLVYEIYIKVDYNGDGIAEWRNVCAGGTGLEILHNEEVDDHPFVTMTAIRLSHNFDGLSVYDLVADIQMIKSTIWRQMLDNIYQVNNARSAVSSKVNLDDYLTNGVASVVRVDTDGREALGNHIHPIVTQPILQHCMPLLQFADEVKEKRSGSTAYNQGLDSDSLNKTATGIERILGQAQKRMLLMARVMAETGFKQIFRKILKLVISHQEKSRIVRLRNDWVPMDPRSWNAEMDCTTNVGLGYGSKDQQVMFMRMLLEIQAQIVQFQGGISGPLVDLDKVHATLEKLTTAMGIKNTDAHFNAPPKEGYQLPEPKPDPEAQKAQAQMQMDQQKMQFQAQTEQQRLLFDGAKADKELEQKEREATLKFELEKYKADLAHALSVQAHQSDMAMRREQMQVDRQAREQDAGFSREMKLIESQYTDSPDDRISAVERLRERFAEEKGIATQGLDEARALAQEAVQAVNTAAQQAVQQVAIIAQQAIQPAIERKVVEIVPGSIRRNAAGDIIGAETVTRAA